MEINYTHQSKMLAGYPEIKKLGIVSPYGECSPFYYKGTMYRLELVDTSKGTDANVPTYAIIRERDTGKILSKFGLGCYYYSLWYEGGDTVYVLGTVSEYPQLCGSSIRLYQSDDLVHWTDRPLLTNTNLEFFNTSLTKDEKQYVLLLEARGNPDIIGDYPFTFVFATSPDMVNWTFMDYDTAFSKERYNGGPYMKYSRGYYYVFSLTCLPCARYSNYLFRTKDFRDWEVGFYNPILMPSREDRIYSDHCFDISDELREQIKTGFNINNSDIDMCELADTGKTLFTYICGDQQGFYYMCEAIYDGSPDDFLANNFR